MKSTQVLQLTGTPELDGLARSLADGGELFIQITMEWLYHSGVIYPIKITSYLDHEISSWTWAALADGPWTDPSLLVLHLFQPFQTTPFVCHLFSPLHPERRSKCFDISGISSAVTLGFVGVILAFWVRILTYNYSFNFREFIWNN